MEKKQKQANAVYDVLCTALDDLGWKYDAFPKDCKIGCSVRGEHLTMELVVKADAEKQTLILLSTLPVNVPPDKRKNMAYAAVCANFELADGCFDFDERSGKLTFRMTSRFASSQFGAGVPEYMLNVSCVTIDSFYERFATISTAFFSAAQIRARMKSNV